MLLFAALPVSQQVEYTYPEFRSVNLRHGQMIERPPQARHEGAQIVTKNNRGDPSWSKPIESQAPQSVRVGAMRVVVPPSESDSTTALPPVRTDDEVARSRRRLYANVKISGAVIDGATMRDLRSRFTLPPVAPQLQPDEKPAR